MTTRAAVDDFFKQSSFAIAGVSRKGKKFGNNALKELRSKGYDVYVVHPEAETIDGEKCYHDFKSLPQKVGGAVLVLPPAQTEKAVKQIHEAGIKYVWMQQGAQSDEAIKYCNENGMNVIHGECIFMFAEPVDSIHKFHRWIWKVIRKYPK
jgi:predicted CoA-binding protein